MDIKHRDLFEEPIIGNITQGSFFNGAVSRIYPDDIEIYGLVISPRCDIEQRKVPVYYYLPAIRLKDWLTIEFPDVYIPKLESDTKDFLQKQLVQCGESETIVSKLKAVDVEEAFLKHFRQPNKKLKEKIELWKALEKYHIEGAIKVVTSVDNTSTSKNVFDELINHKNSNYYFMENKGDDGYVLRMREINRLTPDVFFRLANGIDKPLKTDELLNNDLRQVKEGDLYMPLYVLKSPFMEHVMQHFLQQFDKIGIEDADKKLPDEIVKLIKKEK